MERMMRLPPLGDRKPSVMLAEMLEYYPAGESTTAVFANLSFSVFLARSGYCFQKTIRSTCRP